MSHKGQAHTHSSPSLNKHDIEHQHHTPYNSMNTKHTHLASPQSEQHPPLIGRTCAELGHSPRYISYTMQPTSSISVRLHKTLHHATPGSESIRSRMRRTSWPTPSRGSPIVHLPVGYQSRCAISQSFPSRSASCSSRVGISGPGGGGVELNSRTKMTFKRISMTS